MEDQTVSHELEEASVQQLETFMKSEGGTTEAILPNIEISKLPKKQLSDSESDVSLNFPLLKQFERKLEEKKVTLDIPGQGIRAPLSSRLPSPSALSSNSENITTFRFKTLPI